MTTFRFVFSSYLPVAFALAATGCGASEFDSQGSIAESRSALASSSAEEASGKLAVGSLAALLDQLDRENTASSRVFTFPTPSGPVRTQVDDFYYRDGYLSITGKAADSDESEFIFKSDHESAYGWIVFEAQDLAWEFTTDFNGQLLVEEVPVSKVFPVCPTPPASAHEPPGTELAAESGHALIFNVDGELPAHVGSYPGGDVLELESRPDSESVLFIDFADTMNGSEPREGHTKADVWQAWAITAAQFYSFDINVTTDRDVYDAAPLSRTTCSRFSYATICPNAPMCPQRSSCGIGTFGTTSCCNNYLYENGYGTGRIISHEIGHAFGLSHDQGSPGGAYFEGLPDFKWTPLMGNVWPGDAWGEEALYQLSKGEYDTATNEEDDFEILSRSLDYVEDDIPDSTTLTIEGGVISLETNWGQIHLAGDTDSWTFTIGPEGGHTALKISRIEDKGGAMLDIGASILDSAGELLAEDNPIGERGANLDLDLPGGEYTLVIEGGAEGTPQDGFSNYSSVGLYGIEGTITGDDGDMGDMGGTGGMGGGTDQGDEAAGTMGGDGAVAGAGAGGLAGQAGAMGASGDTAGAVGGNGGVAAVDAGGSAGEAGAMGVAAAGASGMGGGSATPTDSQATIGGTSTGGAGGLTPVAKSSGCACRTGAARSTGGTSFMAALAIFGAVWRRRRRCPKE